MNRACLLCRICLPSSPLYNMKSAAMVALKLGVDYSSLLTVQDLCSLTWQAKFMHIGLGSHSDFHVRAACTACTVLLAPLAPCCLHRSLEHTCFAMQQFIQPITNTLCIQAVLKSLRLCAGRGIGRVNRSAVYVIEVQHREIGNLRLLLQTMSNTTDWFQCIGSLFSVILALLAIIVTWYLRKLDLRLKKLDDREAKRASCEAERLQRDERLAVLRRNYPSVQAAAAQLGVFKDRIKAAVGSIGKANDVSSQPLGRHPAAYRCGRNYTGM